MKRGFFGGSFDPIHFGHIRLVVELMELHGLDEVLFCPAACSPFKTAHPPHASGEHRLKMVELAIRDIPGCKASGIEIERGGASYTIDTLKELGGQWHLLLTDEAMTHFSKWKDAEELRKLAPPLSEKRKDPISSTQIRKRLSEGLYCAHLVPSQVLEYIEKHRLYRERAEL
jgi:nicotinate-nucleotide adenylyltransferase